MSAKFPNIINGIRGLGLIQGLVINESYTDTKTITLKAFEKGCLIRTTGDIIALSPPLIISKNQIDELVNCVGEVLKEIE